jgi:ABC-type siderophore export system fused ATPase/permease subunit
VITHDDRYFDIADQLIRLKNGFATDGCASSLKNCGSVFLRAMKARQRVDSKAM